MVQVHTHQCGQFQPNFDHIQSHRSNNDHDGEAGNLKLQEIFDDKLAANQITSVCNASGEEFVASMECLLSGPTIHSLLLMINRHHAEKPTIKVDIDFADISEDAIAFYKNQPVWIFPNRSLFELMINQPLMLVVLGLSFNVVFIQNSKITLFDGNARHLRPHCSAKARSSGLKMLGMMVGRSIIQDGIGFPYLAPVCYWYVAGREQKALEILSIEDLNKDVGCLVIKVCNRSYIHCVHCFV